MNKVIHKNAGLLATIGLTFLILTIFYSPILFHPQDYLFVDSGDAIKNYYCYAWHVQNDSSITGYNGSNYPFGEHHGYTDGNPLLSNLIRILPFLKNYSIAIFHLSLMVSFLLCSVLLFRIFRLLGVDTIYAVIASVGITFLCPQGLRLSGHFTLAYVFSIPLVLLLLLKQERYPEKKRYLFLIGGVNLLLLFIHTYLGMICIALILFYQVISLLVDTSSFLQRLKLLVVQVAAPILIFLMYIKLVDVHTDRIAVSYGFSYFTSSIETIFISTHKPFRHFLSQIYPITQQNSEGVAYIGILCVFTLPILAFLALKKRKRIGTWVNAKPLRKKYFFLALASLLLLAFSMRFPFETGIEWLGDHIPFLKQFRARGRFAWPFYFVTTIAVTVLVSNYFLKTKNKLLKQVVTLLSLSLFLVEGIPYHYQISKNGFAKNSFSALQLDPELSTLIHSIKEKKAQALIPLPFFHIGTDYYNLSGSDKIIHASLIACYHSKTPLMAGLTGRSSLTEAEKLIQLVSDEHISRSIKNDVSQDRSFLIFYSKETITAEESTLLAKGKLLLETDNFILKEISYAELFSAPPKSTTPLQEVSKGNFVLSYDSYFYSENFDTLPVSHFTGNARGTNDVYFIPSNSLQKDTVYSVSFWYQTRDRLDLDNILTVSEITSDNDSLTLATKNIKSMNNVRDQKVLARLQFKTEHPENRIVIRLKGISDREKVFYLDDLMIVPENNSAYLLDGREKTTILSLDNIPN